MLDRCINKNKSNFRHNLRVFEALAARKELFQNKRYKEKRNIKEASKWAEKNLNVGNVNYNGFDIDVANGINKQLEILQNRFPEIRINNIDLFDRVYKKALVKYPDKRTSFIRYLKFYKRNTKSQAIALSNYYGKYEGIAFMRRFAKDKERINTVLKSSKTKSYYRLLETSLETLITHEFSHTIYYYLYNHNLDSYINDLWTDINRGNHSRAKHTITRKLSLYAATDISEFYAEAMTEYLTSDTPRDIALCVGIYTEEVLNKYKQLKQINSNRTKSSI